MRVSDIFLECQRITGFNEESLNFTRISDAVECLSNKGLVDAMQGYLEILAPVSRTITLPRDVEVPVKVNIGNHPSFGRTKLYEFTMNAPGSNYSPTDWSWNDQGTAPTMVALTPSSTLKTTSNTVDNGKKIYVWGRDSVDLTKEVYGVAILNGAVQPLVKDNDGTGSAVTFSSITRVVKDATLYGVALIAVTGPVTLSTYAPDETEPAYRQIKISQAGESCHILFRRTVYRISSQNDWIPVQSRMGLYCMLRANEFYRKADPQLLQAAQALEKQAEQFVNEEQKSRNVFAEVASQTEKDSARGKYFTNRDSIIVEDIYDEAAEICGPIGEQRVFDRISESIEALSNKAQWDAMTAYLDISVAAGNVVTLPREVEAPIKINVNSTPSFGRDRLYEFTVNGPGPNMLETTDFTWMEQGNVPIVGVLTAPTKLKAYSTSAGDAVASKTLTVFGKSSTGLEISDVLQIDATSPTESVNTYATITRVIKDITTGAVILQASTVQTAGQDVISAPPTPGGTPLAYYYPEEVEPTYRRIILSKSAAAVRIMFRKASMRVMAMSDLIPLSSRAAITCMLRSFEAYRSKDPNAMQMSKAYEDRAVQLLQDEQKSRNVFSDFTVGDKTPTTGFGINNRDSIIVADIYDDVCDIVGRIGREGVFDKITQGIEMLSNKGQWDGNGLEGYVDISSIEGVVTLPRYVDYPLTINIGNRPAQIRNRWFEFHLNGPGTECYQSCSSWTDLGDVVALNDLTASQGVVYASDGAGDVGKTIRIFGYDENDKWIIEDGEDGFEVTAILASLASTDDVSEQKVKRIERITRGVTAGFCRLTAYDLDALTTTELGYYYPDETEPQYRRIKLPCGTCWIRMRYRKRQLAVRSLTAPLHLRSRLAILAAVKSIEALFGDAPNPPVAQAFEMKAVEYLAAEHLGRNPGESLSLQLPATWGASREVGQY